MKKKKKLTQKQWGLGKGGVSLNLENGVAYFREVIFWIEFEFVKPTFKSSFYCVECIVSVRINTLNLIY